MPPAQASPKGRQVFGLLDAVLHLVAGQLGAVAFGDFRSGLVVGWNIPLGRRSRTPPLDGIFQ